MLSAVTSQGGGHPITSVVPSCPLFHDNVDDGGGGGGGGGPLSASFASSSAFPRRSSSHSRITFLLRMSACRMGSGTRNLVRIARTHGRKETRLSLKWMLQICATLEGAIAQQPCGTGMMALIM